MATRSYIARKTPRGYQAVYAHWDGDPEHNGRILFDHYSDTRKLARLMSRGDISVLTPKVGRKHKFEHRGDVHSTTFYGRDRGDKNSDAHWWPTIEEALQVADNSGTEFVYLRDRGTWYVADRGPQFFGGSDGSPFSPFRPLASVLSKRSAA